MTALRSSALVNDRVTPGRALIDLSSYDDVLAIAVQADGAVWVAGYSYVDTGVPEYEGYRAALARLNADGSLDTSFGDGGTALLPRDIVPTQGDGVAVQADGKYLIASPHATDHSTVLTRLNPDGTLDAGFANAGVASIDIAGDYDYAGALTLLGDGSILVGGQRVYKGGADISLIRLTPDGQLDTRFGADPGHFLPVRGSEGNDRLTGATANESLQAGTGDDVLDGGGGRDLLAGGEGRDVFKFSRLEDSYRTSSQGFADRILDFNPADDRIDVAALGFTGLGDGHDGTLAVVANASGTRTYLKSFDADGSGRRFEVSLEGDLVSQLTRGTFVFAADQATTPDLGLLGVSEPGEGG